MMEDISFEILKNNIKEITLRHMVVTSRNSSLYTFKVKPFQFNFFNFKYQMVCGTFNTIYQLICPLIKNIDQVKCTSFKDKAEKFESHLLSYNHL